MRQFHSTAPAIEMARFSKLEFMRSKIFPRGRLERLERDDLVDLKTENGMTTDEGDVPNCR